MAVCQKQGKIFHLPASPSRGAVSQAKEIVKISMNNLETILLYNVNIETVAAIIVVNSLEN